MGLMSFISGFLKWLVKVDLKSGIIFFKMCQHFSYDEFESGGVYSKSV